MLRPAERIHTGHRPVGSCSLSDPLPRLEELVLWRAADALDHFGGVPRVMSFHQLKDATRVLQCLVDPGVAVLADLIRPARPVVVALLLVVPSEQAIRETKARFYDERGVGVGLDILVLDLVL